MFVKTWYSNRKNARSTNKGFQKHKSSKCSQRAIQTLVEILKTSPDVSTMLKNKLTETQCENRLSLLKILSCLRCLARQVLPLRGYGDDKDSNFKQLLNFRGEDDLEFDKWLKKENQTYTSPEIKNEMLKDNESYYTP